MLGFLWFIVGSYLVAASFALVRNWAVGSHGERRVSARDTGRVALEAVAWPVETLWLLLQPRVSQFWAMTTPRVVP